MIFLKLSISCGIKVFFKTSNVLAGTGILHQWFIGYLKLRHRSQKGTHRNFVIFLSSNLNIYAGVPQGSVFKPLYIFDILQMCRLFADNSSFQHASYDKLDIEYNLNHDLHDLVSLINPKQRLIFFLNKKQYNFFKTIV